MAAFEIDVISSLSSKIHCMYVRNSLSAPLFLLLLKNVSIYQYLSKAFAEFRGIYNHYFCRE